MRYIRLSVVLLLAACGDGGTTPTSPPAPPTPPTPVATSILVSPNSVSLNTIGETQQLTATVKDQNGATMSGASVTWSATGAAVTVSSTGLVTAIANGGGIITATSGSASGTAAVIVAQAAASVVLSDTVLSFASLGDTTQLTAEAKDADGQSISGGSFTWASSDTTVASVSTTGLVTAVANGTATITVTSGSASATASASIEQVAVSITLSPDSLVFAAAGDTATVTAMVKDAGSSEIPSPNLTWSSSDTTAVTVNSNGLVTAVASGPATVTAQKGDLQATLSAKVSGSYLAVTVTGDDDPLSDVAVWLTDPDATNTKKITDSAGTVLFQDLRAGEHRVKLMQLPTGLTITDTQTFQASEDEGQDLVFAGTFASAQVTGTAKSWGKPVEGVLVRIEGKDTVEVTANSLGVFQVDSIRRGAYTLTISNYTGINFKEATLTRTLQSGANNIEFIGRPDPEVTWASVSAGAYHTCGMTTSGEAYCTGRNNMNQLGDGTLTDRWWPTLVSGGLTFKSISAGAYRNCGVTTAGEAYCWGDNRNGGLGDGTTTDRSEPTLVSGGITTWASVSAGAYHTCGLTTAGKAYCWGDGYLGDGTTTQSNTPVLVSGEFTWASISAGSSHTCGLTDEGLPEGVPYCWGDNRNGELGDGTTTGSNAPVLVSGGLTFASLSTGWQRPATCGFTNEGVAHCWGSNVWKILAHGTDPKHTTPVPVDGGHKWVAISLSDMHACGATTSGDGYCWGVEAYGVLGNGYGCGFCGTRNWPQRVSGGLTFASISVGSALSCGVTTAGKAYCWGNGEKGALGIGSDLTGLRRLMYALVPYKVGGNW